MTTIIADSLQDSVSSPVFLYEISPSDGAVVAPTLKPFTLGRTTLGTLPYPSTTSGTTTFYFSDADWTDRQTTPPSLADDFTTSTMPSGYTYTRAGNAWGWNSSGVFTQYGADVPRVGMCDANGRQRGMLVEGSRTNQIRNSSCSGAAAGTPGTLPTYWGDFAGGGLTSQVIGSGTDANGVPYLDMHFYGASTSSSAFAIDFEQSAICPALTGQVWTLSCYMKLIAGSVNNINLARLAMIEQTGAPADVLAHYGSGLDLSNAALGTQFFHYTITTAGGATTAYLYPFFEFLYSAGQVIDATIRFSLPQLELGYFPSSPIVTTAAAATRNADVCYKATSGTWWSASGNMIYLDCCIPYENAQPSISQRGVALDDGSNNEYVTARLDSGTFKWTFNHTGASQASLSVLSPMLYNTNIQTAGRYAVNDFAAVVASGSVATDSSGSIPVPTTLRIGHRNNGAAVDFLYGYVARVSIWALPTYTNAHLQGLCSIAYPPPWIAATSTRANVHYEGRCDTPSLDRTLPLTPEAAARSVLAVGDIGMNNTDGYFDSIIKTYAVDGRAFSVKLLENSFNKYSDAIDVVQGVGVDWIVDKDKIRMRTREKSFALDVPLLGLFGGTGSGDGTSANVGVPIPQAYGLCRNIVGELVDPTLLIYRFHDRAAQSVDAVYDRGAPVTAGSGYASYALLAAAATAAGHYDWALTSSGSYYRLGSSPSGTVTADVHGDASGGYVGTTGAIIELLMLRGTVIGDIDTTALTAIDAALTGEIGIYFTAQLTISNAIDQVCQGTFTFWGDIGNNLLGAYQFTSPDSVTPVYEINEYAIIGEITPLNLPDTIGPTVWRRSVGYKINWSPQSGTDIVPAPTITDARRKQLQDGYQTVTVADSSRTVKNLMAVDAPVLVSLFDASADATTLANSILSLYAPNRRLWSVPVGLIGYRVRLNDVVLLKWPRFDLTNGVNVRVVGISYSGPEVILTVYGGI